jgi:glutathione S-transferase
MILIGQYDSPFVRRVAVAMRLYGLAYEHRPWSVFGDAAAVARYNPLTRVPTLVLDDGGVVIDSAAILDHLDQTVGPDRALIAATGPARRHALRIMALGTGLAEKAVSLVYERVLHDPVSAVWAERCGGQIAAVLNALEGERVAAPTPFWFGTGPGHADITVACAVRFAREAHPDLVPAGNWPAIEALAKRCEALPVFGEVTQVFAPPRR